MRKTLGAGCFVVSDESVARDVATAMTSPTLLMYPRTPFPQRRPLQSPSSPSSSSPLRSSPLNPNYRLSNPPSERRASSSSQFHVQSRYIRPVNKSPIPVGGIITSGAEAPPQKAIWRQRFRQKCAERAERDRAKYRDAMRLRSGDGMSGAESSQCSDPNDDMDMDEGDAMDDSVSKMTRSHFLTLHAF